MHGLYNGWFSSEITKKNENNKSSTEIYEFPSMSDPLTGRILWWKKVMKTISFRSANNWCCFASGRRLFVKFWEFGVCFVSSDRFFAVVAFFVAVAVPNESQVQSCLKNTPPHIKYISAIHSKKKNISSAKKSKKKNLMVCSCVPMAFLLRRHCSTLVLCSFDLNVCKWS